MVVVYVLSLTDWKLKWDMKDPLEGVSVAPSKIRFGQDLEDWLRDYALGRVRDTTHGVHTEGISVSGVLRKFLETYTEDVGPEGVMIRLTPYYREQLVRRLRDYPDQKPSAVLERFLQLALDGSWLLTDREG